MIFLSVQPDSIYFVWQVELQLFNLQQKNWPAKGIHVLFAYSEEAGVNREAKSLCEKFPDYPIFFYPDTRKNKKYASTIRPHLLQKHFAQFPELKHEAIFYIDSDVIFREIPDFTTLLSDDNWYASDTQSYMSCDLLIDALGYDVFENMCRIVGVSAAEVIKNKSNTGGAQYIIKDIPADFWCKVENESNELYDYLHHILFENTNHDFFKNYSVSIWQTEMWVVYWNTILAGKPFVVHPMMDFCWANETRARWNTTYMLHYTGGTKGNFFRKTDFTYATPFYRDLSYIPDESSSVGIRDLIQSYRSVLNQKRIKYNDVTLAIWAHDVVSLKLNLDYLSKYVDSTYMVIGDSSIENVCKTHISDKIQFILLDGEPEKNVNDILSEIDFKTDKIGVISSDSIIPIQQIQQAIDRTNDVYKVCPYTKSYKMDVLTSFLFEKLLDCDFLISNKGKLLSSQNESTLKCFFVNRKNDPSKAIAMINGYLFLNN